MHVSASSLTSRIAAMASLAVIACAAGVLPTLHAQTARRPMTFLDMQQMAQVGFADA